MSDSERKYIELIFEASRKYASWDPEVKYEVGDWGIITKGKPTWMFWRTQRGIFLKMGNIYKDGTAKKYNIAEPTEYGKDATEDATWVTSNNAEEIEIGGGGGTTTGVAPVNVKVKAGYKFSSGAGAILVMDSETITTLETPGSLRNLLEEAKMKDHVVVSEVHRCSSYARYLSAKSGGDVTISLTVDSTVVNVASAEVNARWTCSSSLGNFKSKVTKERDFYPLIRLVSLNEGTTSVGFRDGGDLAPLAPLPEAVPPWLEKAEEKKVEGSARKRLSVLIGRKKAEKKEEEPAAKPSESEPAAAPAAAAETPASAPAAAPAA